MNLFEQLIRAIIADPSTPVADLEWMDAAAIAEVVSRFNAHECGAAPEDCIHELFEQQAALTPDREALVYGSGSVTYVTYAELDR